MNIDGAGKVRRTSLIQPVVIGEPRLRFGDHHQFPASRMIEMKFLLPRFIQYTLHPIHRLQQSFHLVNTTAIIDIDMRDLMVGHRECSAGTGIEQLAAHFLSNRQQPLLP